MERITEFRSGVSHDARECDATEKTQPEENLTPLEKYRKAWYKPVTSYKNFMNETRPEDEYCRVQLQQSMPQSFATKIDLSRLSQEHLCILMEKMKCVICKWIPKPGDRYICNKGHLFCMPCGHDRIQLTNGVCAQNDIEVVKCVTAKYMDTYDSIYYELPVETPTPLLGHRSYLTACQKKLEVTPCDPVYNALYNNLTMKCPLGDHATCVGYVLGKDMDQHLHEFFSEMNSTLGGNTQDRF